MGVTLSLSTYGAFLAPIPSQMSGVTNCPSPSHLSPPPHKSHLSEAAEEDGIFCVFFNQLFPFARWFHPGVFPASPRCERIHSLRAFTLLLPTSRRLGKFQ